MQRVFVPGHPCVCVCAHISTRSVSLDSPGAPLGMHTGHSCNTRAPGSTCSARQIHRWVKGGAQRCPVCEEGLPSRLTDPAEGTGGTEPRSVSPGRVPLFEQDFQHGADTWLHIPLCCWGCRQLQPRALFDGVCTRGDPKGNLPLLPPHKVGGEQQGCQSDLVGCCPHAP